MEVSKKNLPAIQRDGHWALRLASKTPEQTIKELEAKLEIMFGDKYERKGKATSDEYDAATPPHSDPHHPKDDE